jgi:Ser/Thr protein kinase RdoA (MazF antagonist)
MAVYTHLGAEDMAALLAPYHLGDLVSAKGIAEGVSNSNWLIETARPAGETARFILTMYEFRIEIADLPYFLGLLDHLAAKGCPVPRSIHDEAGNLYRVVDTPRGERALALIEFLPGVSLGDPTPARPARWARRWPRCTGRRQIIRPPAPTAWAWPNGNAWRRNAAPMAWPASLPRWQRWWPSICRASPRNGPPACRPG